jgi:hypothetical protein
MEGEMSRIGTGDFAVSNRDDVLGPRTRAAPASRATSLSERLVTVAYCDNLFQAELLKGALGQAGIPAVVYDLPGRGNMRACQVQVRGPDAERALAALAKARPESGPSSGGAGAVECLCEGCGDRISFPRGRRGTVQQCPRCDTYIDVPEV